MFVRIACMVLMVAGASICLATTILAATPEQRAEDLAVFETKVLMPDRSFSAGARARANAMLARLKRDAAGLNDAEFQLRLAEISAQAGNGHTLLYNTAWKRDFNRLPLMFLIASGELYVAKAAGNPDLEGSRVVTINGMRFSDLRKLWSRYQSGPQGRHDDFLYAFLESPQMLTAAGVGATPDSVKLITEKAGQHRTTVVAGRRDIAPPSGTWLTLPRPRVEELQALESPEVRPPLYLRDLSTPFRIAHLGEVQAAYIQFRANFDPTGGNANPGRFSGDAIRRLQFLAPRFVILDQRFNIGGDANRTRGLMEALPSIVGPAGHVFVLVSGRTFSAGISSVAYLKQAGGSRVTIIGTEMGDGPSHWSEGTTTTLPHSRAVFLNALERHDYLRGCPGPECHWAEKERPVRLGRALTPDIRAEQTWSDYVNKRDTLLDTALAQIKSFAPPPDGPDWRIATAIGWRQNAPVPFTDPRDGRVYSSLVFGNQVWMAENLAYLPRVCRVDENGCGFWVRNFNGSDPEAAKQTQSYKISGVLYDWSSAQTACPAGWRLPSDADWQRLEMSLGMPSRQAETGGWRNDAVASRLIRGGDTGFNIDFGGARSTNGVFDLPDSGIFWCSDEIGPNHGCERVFGRGRRELARDTGLKQAGFSVRCLRNSGA